MDLVAQYKSMLASFAAKRSSLDDAFLAAKENANDDDERARLTQEYSRDCLYIKQQKTDAIEAFRGSMPALVRGKFNAIMDRVEIKGGFEIIRAEDKLAALKQAEDEAQKDSEKEIEPCRTEF